MWEEGIDSTENQAMLRSFRQLLESCFGPKGGVKMILSGGGYLTYTSSSNRLLKNLQFQHPIISMLSNFVKSHQNIYEDCGLYIVILSCSIIEQSWASDHACKSLSLVFDRCVEVLKTGVAAAELCSVSHMMAVAEAVLSSKPGCGISCSERRHLGVELVKGFVSSVGEKAETEGLGRVLVVTQSGPSVDQSELVDCLLYPYPEAEHDPLSLQLCKRGATWRIMLYSCMLNTLPTPAQECDEYSVVNSLHHKCPIVDYFKSVLPQLTTAGVNLVACQKVVHPDLQILLRRSGILVLHRLGTELAYSLQRMTGAHALDAPTGSEWKNCLGVLDSVTPIMAHEKLYLQLRRKGADLCTLLLCSPMPHSADELEIVTRQAISNLQHLLLEPKLVPGAGCFESWLSWRLHEDVRSPTRTPCTLHSLNNFIALLSCYIIAIKSKHPRPGELLTALNWVESALLRIPRLIAGVRGPWELTRDSLYHHAWREEAVKCLCGLLSRETLTDGSWSEMPSVCPQVSSGSPLWHPTPECVVDVYRSKVHAIKTAFEACKAVLAIRSVIHT